ncbi:hypothetical protein [Fischerella sp. PCC 9605]|nr:hypothetical protein [Fischerella sp. PCC 9605]
MQNTQYLTDLNYGDLDVVREQAIKLHNQKQILSEYFEQPKKEA